MQPFYRLKKLTAYPEWHKNPLRLDRAEILNPYSVLREFFDKYDLINIRVALKQWLDDAVHDEAESASHLYTHENLEKLVEAAWLVLELRDKAANDEGLERKPVIGVEEVEMYVGLEADSPKRRRFEKLTPFPPSLKANPIACLKRVFQIIDLKQLTIIIPRWEKYSLTTGAGHYDQAGEREDLVEFCEGLLKLVQITYVIQRRTHWEVENKLKWFLTEQLTLELLMHETGLQLTEEEISDPQGMVNAFFTMFSLSYCFAELWEMLNCRIIQTKEMSANKNVLLEFECLKVLLEAAFDLYDEPINK